jgi:hypothetical protein|tara:strand:- start:1259 stop:6613 length:5355 start_codon:yes stop_codon:yes gene_type:complete
MPLNKLDNFIKNTEGRILYVNPSDLDSTDSITNQGNSLGRPFKTIQRALIESARFSYQKGIGNDKTDRTTILLFPGDHIVDNRPGWGIYGTGAATLLKPDGTTYTSFENIDLNLETNFDLEQEDNVLYKFNSVYGGVIVPRGTSIIGLDLRKTKIIPKYVPNPTEYLGALDRSAIFRITGNCYFWQFSIFDAKESTTAYTSPTNFTDIARPTFSHHKLTCFEYADGVNIPKELSTNYTITDLDMYYAKLSNAYGESSGSGTSDRSIDEKWPSEPDGFAKERPEYEIVGAFSADPISITNIISGDGQDSSSVITVTTGSEHGLTAGTPIKIDGVGVPGDVSSDYNISAIVTAVQSKTQFTYSIPAPDPLMPASFASLSGDETVTVETDTVKGASPYIFNISLRSVYGMNGMHADGTKATGFRSMVVAQFTAISLQKDDRAFVKYNKSGRDYDGIEIETQRGAELSGNSASTNPDKVYHLDSEAVYRTGWETAHIKISNNSVMQIVSVFAIGFHHHFECNSGGDASITNSNSNFGQMALVSDGFRPDAFTKDDHAYVTSIIPPRAIVTEEKNIDWFALDVPTTATTGISSHLYISGFEGEDNPPPVITQGYKVGAREGDKLYVDFSATTGYGVSFASIQMCDNVISLGSSIASGATSSVKEVTITGFPSAANGYTFTSSVDHNFNTEEKVLVFSKTGNIPEGLADHNLYYAIRISNTTFRLATSVTNARNNVVKSCFGGTDITVRSRVSDKFPGEVGSPVQFDPTNNKWFVHTEPNSDIYTAIATLGSVGIGVKTKISSIKRKEDTRSLDEKVYILRVVIPREARNSKNPEDGFVIQESSSTNISITPTTSEFTATTIESGGVHLYDYKRNPRFISTCSVSSNEITAVTDLPHNLNVNDTVVIKGVQSGDNTAAEDNLGYNGKFIVTGVGTNQFTYSTTDIFGVNHSPVTEPIQTFQNNANTRDISLPRFERKDLQTNLYVYRNEILSDYVEDTQDGVYHIYAVKANNKIETASGEFSTENFGQNVVNLYPENDRDNPNDNPNASVSFAKRSPIGDVVTNDLKKSITREAIDDFITKFEHGKNISGFARDNTAGITTFTLEKDHGFSGLVDVTISEGGSTYVAGTYHNVKIYNESSLDNWNGATAKVTVGAGGDVTEVDIISSGSAYSPDTYFLEDSKLGYSSGTQAELTVATSNISDPTNAIAQITGDGSVSDGHYYITSIPGKRQVAVAMTAGDPEFTTDQYLYINEPSTSIATTSISTSGTNNIITFNCSAAHGLLAGHRVSILDSNNNKVGSYIVKSKVGINTFTVQTSDPVSTFSVNGGKVLKHALDANEAISEAGNQNFGIRSNSLYAGEIATLTQGIVDESSFTISIASGSIPNRFKLGDYIQIDGEIMRISGAFSSPATITVIRGYFGTQKTSHTNGSRIKKIKPIPVEFRRPSIIRASGHTFEYLGYGPGNYSTGLPQVQVRSLTEREEFLSQSKEKSCGAVVYTGMNNDGDFFIGNKRVTSATGEEKTFDAPVPTVTGEDPSRLSSIFDEITIKERLKVEGGKSKQILSQFDGPVTFNNEVKVIGSNLEINNDTETIDETTGALVVTGGVGIAKSVVINGGIAVNGSSEFAGVKFENNSVSPASGILTVRSNTLGGHGEFPSLTLGGTVLGVTNSIGFNTNTTITGFLSVTDDITAFWTSDERLKDNINTIEQPLNKVISISGNTFDWNEKSNKTGHDVGLIAQEIEQVLPEAVVTRDNGYLAVDYHKVVPLLVEAIKELSTKVDSLEQKLNDIDK